MIFEFKNVGKINKGHLSLSDITIITGENNTGKTYITYSIYGLFLNLENKLEITPEQKIFSSVVNEYITSFFNEDKVSISNDALSLLLELFLSNISNETSDNLHTIFKAEKSLFSSSKVSIKAEKDLKLNLKDKNFSLYSDNLKYQISFKKLKSGAVDIILDTKQNPFELENISYDEGKKNIEHYKVLLTFAFDRLIKSYFDNYAYSPLVASSERSSISLFYKQLDESNSHILNNVLNRGLKQGKKGKINLNSVSKFALPIKDNIDKVRSYYSLYKKECDFYLKNIKIQNILKSLVGGGYEDQEDNIYYIDEKGKKHQLHTASSSVKSLFLIDFYIKNLIEKNTILIIDEPEANLHPNKQILMAQLIVELALSGVKILLTTHSDYLLREINNCIMASNVDGYKHKFRSPISSKKIKAYAILPNGVLEELSVHKKYGLDAKYFDEIITLHQNESDEIFGMVK